MPSDPLKPWGPDNPHPLSRMKTELVWEGKYDEHGNRRSVRLPSFPLVLQPIEHVDVPWDEKKAQQQELDFQEFRRQAHPDDFRNMLIWGDNKIALAALLDQFRGKVDLIYIDPPFDVGADFTMQIALGDEGDAVAKEQSVLEAVAYRDTWGKGTDSYLHMMADRLSLMAQLLKANGLVMVHCDTRVNFAMHSLLDEAIGAAGFRNEIVWKRQSAHSDSGRCGNVHDTLFLYAKGPGHTWNEVLVEPSPDYVDTFFDQVEADTGRRYARGDLSAGGLSGGGYDYEYKGIRRVWRCPRDTMDRLAAEGRLHWPRSGVPRLKRYLDEFRGVALQDVWADVRVIHNQSAERLGYDTQKPESLLERIIRASSNDGDLVLDCFCGSGTTMAVAEKLGRRWVGVDLGRYAIHVSRKRLMGIQRELHKEGKPYRPFDVYNLCRYERQWWQMERLRGADHEHRSAVLRFFRAAPLDESPSPLLHGTKGGATVHVAPIDTLVTLGDAEKVARAAAGAGAKRAIILAWEFEMDLRKRIEAVQAETGVHVAMKYIPREIMEPNRDEVQFFDAGALEAEAFVVDPSKRTVDVRLKSFIPSLAEVPEKELDALRERVINSPFDFIDFWAVDFEHGVGKTYFDHHWHAYRTRKDRKLPTESACKYAYQSPGRKRICVKVIDVFGVDTSVVVEVSL